MSAVATEVDVTTPGAFFSHDELAQKSCNDNVRGREGGGAGRWTGRGVELRHDELAEKSCHTYEYARGTRGNEFWLTHGGSTRIDAAVTHTNESWHAYG